MRVGSRCQDRPTNILYQTDDMLYLLFVNLFLSVVRQKKTNQRFLGFEPGTKISLAIVTSLLRLPTTSRRDHKYYIPSYLQVRCVSCRVSLAATQTHDAACNFCPDQLGCVRLPRQVWVHWLTRKLGLRAAAPIVRVECCRGVGQSVQ